MTKPTNSLLANELTVGDLTSGNRGYQFTPDPTSLSISIGNILSNILSFLTIIAGIAFVFYFMLGAISWITSSGDTQKVQTAQKRITQALIGILVTAAAYPIAYVLTNLVGIPMKEPYTLIYNFVF